MINTAEINFDKMNGLVPAIIVDYSTGKVLMLGFMNKEAYNITIETKHVTFFSRTKNALWTKGETSGNFLNFVDLKIDCDNDSLLIYALPEGNTCHKDQYSCFGINRSESGFLNELFELVRNRKIEMPENSYTTKLFKEGIDRIAQKVGEESIETVIASKNDDNLRLIDETSDLIFHLFVLLAEKNIEWNEVVNNLLTRHQDKRKQN
ncbi:MAG: bifunctional phosphoribosyl-AMP cyclohydrolase/phosphoribosyl-ATP diphosphatase HisIE [Melioribacteraceae bacterium]|nr:bifunctional phosphoribosyl-AMP cyclohydrolase/phosphoribosyl-ATP diphosphatase HisIE [Melioribacteraceae bacterium]MCF8354294.1 bifunctional phosphoribosyl-AMP cyclohydrolase/phosphoribosyl-ATP diphosphatase HisIE [Melioribacteraceae bacterium]MCF8394574.1 bifunctional phosphoribosyl-AMP cyclohydrolase/phosphoribosyl-ATP diphosphatase HisIE [Melioribacteraceae bacterium]MCF8419757.1 bifunctional phosphoribosyl-AMP cyclohydrolase/phosphoribosyl-ATP diphosphatase HisIE [Melioribacteraceae bact